MMSDRTKSEPVSEWEFWSLSLKIGVPVATVAVLFLLARMGDTLALSILVAIGTLTAIGLGVFVTLRIMDQMRQAEQLRFTQNLYENLRLTGQMQQIQGAQAKSLLDQNARLIRSLPDPSKIDVKQLEALTWDVYDEEPARSKW